MTNTRKPELVDLTLRGVDVADAIVVLERWDSMSDKDRDEMIYRLSNEPARAADHG